MNSRPPRSRRSRRHPHVPALATVLALILASMPGGVPPAAAATHATPDAPRMSAADASRLKLERAPTLDREPAKDPSVDWRVAAVAVAEQGQGAATALQRAHGLGLDVVKGRVRLIVEASDLTAARRSARAASIAVEGIAGDLIQVLAAPGQLRKLARAAGVRFLRPPLAHVEDAVAGQGVGVTNAGAWHAAGLTGGGVKIAIIDGGFAGLSAAQASGDLPATLQTADHCNGNFSTATQHGTAVAEIVHEMAPDAELYLLCMGTEVQLAEAVADAEANGVRVITHSVSWFNSARGDGTGGPGTPDATAADARASGILWVNAAGNQAGTHWTGTFVDDGSADHWNLFAPGDVGNGFFLGAGATACAFLKWDDWPGSDQDYDLWIVDEAGHEVAWSTNTQAGVGPPTEETCYTNPAPTAAPFYVLINKWLATETPRFDLFVAGASEIQYPVAQGSVTEPASSPATLAAGAVCWAAATIEPFSSRGPTIDARVKPDISGPDQVSGTTYGPHAGCGSFGGFPGTSAAAPHVAGAAALVLEANPGYTVDQVEASLESSAIDLGDAGPDTTFGAGMLRLPAVLAPTTTSLVLDPNPVTTGLTSTLTATVAPNPASGSIEWIIDGHPAAETTPVGLDGTAMMDRTYDTPGIHTVQAHFVEGTAFDPSWSPEQVLTVVAPDTGITASGVGVSDAKLYPYKDGYRDTLAIRGTPGEPLSVGVKVYNSSAKKVRSWSLATGTAPWSISWNGRKASGTRLPAGTYRVTQTLRDELGHTKTYTSYAKISNKRLYWYTATITKHGDQFSLRGDSGSGSVSTAKSSFDRGVRLKSGTAWAAVRYSFTVRSAKIYGPLKFKVLGRSPNGRLAYEGLWNRTYGPSDYLDAYDVKQIGPGYRWYSIKGASSTHRKDRSARGLVFVGYSGVGHTFDVSKVRLTYGYAVLR